MVSSPFFLPHSCSFQRIAWHDGLEAATKHHQSLEYRL